MKSSSSSRCSTYPTPKIENNRHPDIHIVESEDEIKIDAIRQLQREISLRPYEARVKFFIIDDAHNFTAEAANAILKVLEEPPKDSLLILISDKPGLLFKTILSRCKIFRFYPLSRSHLQDILISEYGLTQDYAHFLAYFCEGRLGRALGLKDTDILTEKNRVIDRFALAGRHRRDDLNIQGKEEIRVYINILATWFRDLYLVKTGLPHAEIINFDRREDLLKTIGRFSFPELDAIIASLSDSILYLDQNINLKLLVYNLETQLWKEQS